MKNFYLILFSLLSITQALGQTLVAEFSVETGRVRQIEAFSLHDSIFVSFLNQDIRWSYWIIEGGRKQEIQLTIPANASLIGVQGKPDGAVYYYYLNEINGQLVLQAMKQSHGHREIEHERSIFQIPGKLLGYHISEEETLLVCFLKKENQIRIFKLMGLEIVHDILCEMPFDLSPHIHNNSGFIAETEMSGIEQGGRTFKLYREENHVVISIDEHQPGIENKKTTIIQIDVASAATVVKEVPRDDHDKFTSFYEDNMVYQAGHLPGRHFTLKITNLSSGKQIFSDTFEKDLMKNHPTITRRGSRVDVAYSSFNTMLTRPRTLPGVVVRQAKDPRVERIILASVYYEPSVVIIPVPLPGLSMPLPIPVGPSNSNVTYFTLVGNPETGYELEQFENNPLPSLRQRIDQFEISQTTGRPKGAKDPGFEYKGYVETSNAVFAIYYQREGKIKLMKYW